MRKFLFASAAAWSVMLAGPAPAITFPSLTTIYIFSGVRDDGGAGNTGIASSISCTNVSGLTAGMRFLALQANGSVAAVSTLDLTHGQTTVISTHGTVLFADAALPTGAIQGSVNVESTQSGVFCSAAIVDADATPEFSFPLHAVRVNPHPGTVE